MCGVEKAAFEQDEEAMERAVRLDVTLHAYMFMQSGIPVLYSGDEVGRLNDYSYKDDPDKAADSRYLHQGKMDWKQAAQVADKKSVAGQIFSQLDRLEKIRRSGQAFTVEADARTLTTGTTMCWESAGFMRTKKSLAFSISASMRKRWRWTAWKAPIRI